MALSLEDVRRIARLARLTLSPGEEARLREELSGILGYVEQLRALDLDGVEPMTHALAAGEAAPLRADEPAPCLGPEEALANAPAREGTWFKVPRILE
jgi:aspartyl-tRNA(Asn)/glutamyl-tRNA(Gln) amidotransferase subunit C